MSAVHDLQTGEELDPFDAAYRRLRAQYDAARQEAERFGGPCEKCRHFKRSGSTVLYETRCLNPLISTVTFNRDAGKVQFSGYRLNSWMTAGASHPELCGSDHVLWEPRLSVWQRFLAWLTA